MIILGIESSCDETAAAVVADGKTILSSVIASQIEVHHRYGGVVPELASRKHIEAVVPVVNEALETSGITPDNLDAVVATQGPGLVGALLVGFSFAKAYAYARELPFCGVNHLEGHINSVFLQDNPPEFPFTALLVSGGHTSIYHVTGHTSCEMMGQTLDDAAGEAFDKVSKMLGLGYPGGPLVGKLAESGDPEKIIFPRPLFDKKRFDFSFSGIKTAVNRYIQTHADTYRDEAADIAAGFQEAVADVLIHKLVGAAAERGCRHIAVAGGVAANCRLREKAATAAAENRLSLHIPPVSLCGDNAAMIAAVGFHYIRDGFRSEMGDDVYSRHKI